MPVIFENVMIVSKLYYECCEWFERNLFYISITVRSVLKECHCLEKIIENDVFFVHQLLTQRKTCQ